MTSCFVFKRHGLTVIKTSSCNLRRYGSSLSRKTCCRTAEQDDYNEIFCSTVVEYLKRHAITRVRWIPLLSCSRCHSAWSKPAVSWLKRRCRFKYFTTVQQRILNRKVSIIFLRRTRRAVQGVLKRLVYCMKRIKKYRSCSHLSEPRHRMHQPHGISERIRIAWSRIAEHAVCLRIPYWVVD